jgi:hypothetical protein
MIGWQKHTLPPWNEFRWLVRGIDNDLASTMESIPQPCFLRNACGIGMHIRS